MSNRLLIRQNLSFFIQFQILMKTGTSSMNLSILNLVLFVTCESSTNKVLLLIKMILKTKPFCMNHKPTARVITQRSSKAATHYIDKLKNLLKKLEKHNCFEQNGFSPQQLSLNPLIIISNGNSIKCVFDARQLRSNTSNLMSHGLLNFSNLRELALAKHTTVILNS